MAAGGRAWWPGQSGRSWSEAAQVAASPGVLRLPHPLPDLGPLCGRFHRDFPAHIAPTFWGAAAGVGSFDGPAPSTLETPLSNPSSACCRPSRPGEDVPGRDFFSLSPSPAPALRFFPIHGDLE